MRQKVLSTLFLLSIPCLLSACAFQKTSLSGYCRGLDGADPLSPCDASCNFSSQVSETDPEMLLTDFLNRDGEGEFRQSSAWFDNALICPSQKQSSEDATVVSDVRHATVFKSDEVAVFEVTYQVEGTLSRKDKGGSSQESFDAQKAELHTTIIAQKTPYGWRLRNPDTGYVTVERVLQDQKILTKSSLASLRKLSRAKKASLSKSVRSANASNAAGLSAAE